MIKLTRSSRDRTVRITFVLPAGDSRAVSVVGDFNDWDPLAHPLKKRGNGTRSVVVTVPTGRTLHFRYLADGGVWFDDDTATAWDHRGAIITT